MRNVTAKPTRRNLDVAVSQQVAQLLRTTTRPFGCGVAIALVRVGRKGLVLQVKRHDDIVPLLPRLAAVLALVVEDVGQSGIVLVVGLLFLVKVPRAVGLAVNVVSFLLSAITRTLSFTTRGKNNSPICTVERICIMGRDESLDALVAEPHERLVQHVERLIVVLANRLLQVGNLGDARAALDAVVVAGLLVDPEPDDLDAVGRELLNVRLLVRLGQALEEVVAGAGPGLGCHGAEDQGALC